MNGRSELLSQPLLDHRLPRHQAEPHAVIEHRVAPASCDLPVGCSSGASLEDGGYQAKPAPRSPG